MTRSKAVPEASLAQPPPHAPASIGSDRLPKIILASGSPRRSEILQEAGVSFEVKVSGIDEITRANEAPETLADRLAREKAIDVARKLSDGPARLVLGADTIVVAGEAVLGKPRDEAHAVELLSRLMGTTHRVMTGFAITWTDGRSIRSQVVTSRVRMRAATKAELKDYVAVGESLDKAGGYALQGEGRRFIEEVEGSRTNVIGLPIDEVLVGLLAASRDSPLARTPSASQSNPATESAPSQ